MGATPLYAWPWPAYTDAADGSGAVKALALAMDTTVKQLRDYVYTPTRGRDMRFVVTTRRGSTQSLPHNATTGIVMDTTETNTLPAPRPEGWYLAAARVTYSGNASGFRQTLYRRSASTSNLPASNYTTKPNGTNMARVPCQDTGIYLVPADIADVAAWQNSGAGLTTFTAEDLCPRLMLMFIHGPRPT